MQFFVQLLYSIEGIDDGYAADEEWFDTIDEATAFVKDHDRGTFTLKTMRMFTGKKPTEKCNEEK